MFSGPSLAVDDPKIDEVLNLETGEILRAFNVIGEDYQKAIQLRLLLRDRIGSNNPLLACPLCAVPVHMVCRAEARQFYFRHETEDGRCPIKTKGDLSEERINAMKYHGARESAAHIRMKQIIADSLACDPDFSNIEIERVWKGIDNNDRRRPDVRAVWRNSLPVAFEVQLSTTFLRVIAERRQFYLRNGGLLLWVFQKFEMGDTRLTQDDIFYNNNRNAFVASEETLLASRAAGAFTLDCIWSEPVVESGTLSWSPERSPVVFKQLSIDQPEQRVFWFDADQALFACSAGGKSQALREDFHQYWTARTVHDDERWQKFLSRFLELNLKLPRHPTDEKGFEALLNTLYTAREGKPIGWRHADLIKVAHHVFDKYKGHLWAFKLVLAAHDRGDLIRRADINETWRNKKVKAYRAAWKNGDPEFTPDRRFDPLVTFLFPEISGALNHAPQ